MFSSKNLALALTASLISAAFALPVRREVPQEHSHEQFLRLVKTAVDIDNPDEILDSVFGLLGNAAAAAGLGKIADVECLQQATADRAFTNSKAANDVEGMTAALIYRGLERNTGKVGQASNPCTSIQAVNPEIAAIQQHQDPASANAAEINKAITLALAQQIAAIGGDPLDALKSGTFAPGDVNDPTAAGNTCDDANDAVGCIFSQNLLVEDVSADEIQAAVASNNAVNIPAACDVSANAGNAAVAGSAAADSSAAANTAAANTAAANTAAANTAAATAASSAEAAANTGVSTAAAGGNLQKFTGALGGVTAPAVTAGGRGFVVANNSDFLNLAAAVQRSCAVQHNGCANAANSNKAAGFSVSDCDAQEDTCKAST